jgi:hypothetical protein
VATAADGLGDDNPKRAQVWPIRAHRVGQLGQLRYSRTLQQHRVGEPFDPLAGHSGGGGHLLDGGSGSDPGLDLTGSYQLLRLDLDLVEAREITSDRCLQVVV